MRRGRVGILILVLVVGFVAAAIPVRGQGAADFPGASWKPALYYLTGRSDYTVSYIIIHATDGERTSGTVNDHQTPKASTDDWASAHYVIANGKGYPDSEAYKEGQIIQMVHDADTAYGVGVWPVGTSGAKHTGTIHNYNTISIELAGLPDQDKWCTEKMYESAAKLVRSLADKYGIPLTRDYILGHDEVAQKCTPPITTRFDPCGKAAKCTFDWSHFMSLVAQATSGPSQSTALSNLSLGLVAWYPFDGDVKDKSGNGNNGVSSGAVSFLQGKIGQAVKLGGVSNVGYIHVPNSSSFTLTNQLTWACFVRLDSSIGQTSADCSGSAVDGAPQCILAKRGDRNGAWSNLYATSGQGSLLANLGINSYADPQNVSIQASQGYAMGSWIHLAFVYSSGQIIEYWNGKETARHTYQPTDLSAVNGSDLYIGIQRNLASEACSGYGPDWWYPLNGAIDDLRIYNRAVSADEVSALASSSAAAPLASVGPSASPAPASGASTSSAALGNNGGIASQAWPIILGGVLAIALAMLLIRALGGK